MPKSYKQSLITRTFDRRNRCINCAFLLPKNFRGCKLPLELESDAMVSLLQSWITPTQLSPECILCTECFDLLQNRVNESEENSSTSPMFGHRSVCFPCGNSILRARTYPVRQDREESNILTHMVPCHLVSRMERVCAACMRSATRQAQRQQQHDENRSNDSLSDDSDAPEPPTKLSPPPTTATVQVPQKIISSTYKRAANTASHCIFNNCFNPGRLCIPSTIKDILLLKNKFYIPPGARVCNYHLNDGSWHKLTSQLKDFTGGQFDDIMTMMQRAANYRLDFSNISVMPSHLVHYWLGMSSEQFYDLLNCIPNLADQVPNATIALCMHLVKSRTGDSNENLAILFNKPRATLERWMTKARDCLINDL